MKRWFMVSLRAMNFVTAILSAQTVWRSLNGFNGDSRYTFAIGEVDEKVMRLLDITKQSLYKGIAAAKSGKRIGDISNAVQTFCERAGYSVVREMCGHGIGKSMHEGRKCRISDAGESARF